MKDSVREDEETDEYPFCNQPINGASAVMIGFNIKLYKMSVYVRTN